MVTILGISAFYHDSAACLVQDGNITAAAQEERFTRKKHDSSFPNNAIDYVLNEGQISYDNLDFVAFYDKPWLKFERILETYLAFAPRGLRSFTMSMPLWLKEKIRTDKLIFNNLGDIKEQFNGQLLFLQHHEAHAASAFYPSPFQEAAILTLDGVGEWATTAYGIGKDQDIILEKEIRFPHSLGLLYSAFTYYAGFKVNAGEYKLMGLAPYGEPKYVDLIYDNLISLKDDGSYKLNMKYFDYCVGLTMTNDHFNQLFGGPPRKPETKLTSKFMDVAASIQKVTEDVILKMARHVRKTTGMKRLCLAGGVALNCVANGFLLKERVFDRIWIQPAAGDAGGALGSALWVWYKYLKNERNANQRDCQRGSYLGISYSNDEIADFINKNNIKAKRDSDEELVKHVAQLIADEYVIGFFNGKMEFGPRALGARSIIGDARSPKMQSLINLKIKFRESFRPFAPSVLVEHVSEWFDLDEESPYMLLVAKVKESKLRKITPSDNNLRGLEKMNVLRSVIPAVTHVDCSARIHTVNETDHPVYYKIINEFFKLTGCPVIINTSFNVRGEPMVCSPQNAYNCFMRTDMDYLVLGNYIIDKKDQKTDYTDISWMKEFELD